MSDILYGRTDEQIRRDAIVLDRVKAGIAWLEATVGPEWVDRVDLSVLDLKSCTHCVCGQVFSGEESDDFATGFNYAEDLLEREGSSDKQCGFFYEDGKEADMLTETWAEQIERIRASR